MAKHKITDYSTTAASNTDIGGIGIQGTDFPRNMDDAVRELASHLAETNAGTYPVDDTWSFADPADRTKIFRNDAGRIATGTTIVHTPLETGYAATQADVAGNIYGLTLSNNVTDATNDIDIAVGRAVDNTNGEMLVLSSGITKRLDAAWAVGSGNGGLDTGTIANTTYHVWLIKRSDTNVVDALFSTSASSPTMPSGYDRKRRIGSIIRSGGTILSFNQLEDEFLLNTPVLDLDTSTLGTSFTSATLTVPSGVRMQAKMRVRGSNASGWVVIISSPNVTDTSSALFVAPLGDIGGAAGVADRNTIQVRTGTSSQVRCAANAASTTLQIATYGWVDRRL